MDKKKEPISLRIDLPETPVSDPHKAWIPQSFTELMNKPKKTFFKHNFRGNETFSNHIDFDKFEDLDLFPNDDSPRSNKSIQSVGELMKQNYSSYFGSIKDMYPPFKFNHYSKYSKKIKKINPLFNLNTSDFKGSELSVATKSSSLVEYQSSTKLASMGLGEEYITSKDDFIISKEILEQNIQELNNIGKLFDNKVEGIEMELDKILRNSALIYNYIEENITLGAQIDRSIKAVNGKRNSNSDLNKKFIISSARIMLMGLKRQNMIKVAYQMKLLHNLSESMNTLLSFSKKKSECNEMSEALSRSKSRLNDIKSIEKMRKVKFVILYEKELMTFGNKSEQKLLEDFASLFKNIFLISLSSLKSSVLTTPVSLTASSSINTSSQNKLPIYDLLQDNKTTQDVSGYSFENKIELLLIAKTDQCQKLLYQLLDVLNVIIKDNMDINTFIELIEEIIKEILMIIFDELQKQYSSQSMKLTEVLSNCFRITYFNYDYIINLFNVNYGLIPKVFSELNKNVLNEMTKLLQFVVSSTLHEAVLSGNLITFTSIKDNITKASQNFLDLTDENLNNQFKSFNADFLLKFFETQSLRLNESFDKEQWSQLSKVNCRYQEIANILLSNHSIVDNVESLNLKAINDNGNENKNENEYLFLKGNKYRLISLTLSEIEFLNECRSLLLSFDKEYHYDILCKSSSIIESINIKSRELIIEGKGKNEEKKFTEKETALLCANINIIRRLFTLSFSIITTSNENALTELNRLNNILIEISSICKEAMVQLLNELVDLIINELNDLDFANYPFYHKKDYNSYVKKFVRMIKLYETMLYSFDNNDIVIIFDEQLKNCFDQMQKVVNSKCRIEADNSLKQ